MKFSLRKRTTDSGTKVLTGKKTFVRNFSVWRLAFFFTLNCAWTLHKFSPNINCKNKFTLELLPKISYKYIDISNIYFRKYLGFYLLSIFICYYTSHYSLITAKTLVERSKANISCNCTSLHVPCIHLKYLVLSVLRSHNTQIPLKACKSQETIPYISLSRSLCCHFSFSMQSKDAIAYKIAGNKVL